MIYQMLFRREKNPWHTMYSFSSVPWYSVQIYNSEIINFNLLIKMVLNVHNVFYFIFTFWKQFIKPLKFTFETNFSRKFIFKIHWASAICSYLFIQAKISFYFCMWGKNGHKRFKKWRVAASKSRTLSQFLAQDLQDITYFTECFNIMYFSYITFHQISVFNNPYNFLKRKKRWLNWVNIILFDEIKVWSQIFEN